ncbi:UNVERIFIED_CONTAM: histidine phosphatase family protein [Microbacterium sp. SLM126]
MIRLALVRHAKSDWDDPLLDDHDRPLNERGRADAPRMAQWYAESAFRPDVILSSTALRARTTAQAFATATGVAVTLQERLYGAGAALLRTAAVESGVDSVMIVAHDPGMSMLAAHLSDDGIAHMPTCAVATFTWDADEWDVATSLDPADWTFDAPR